MMCRRFLAGLATAWKSGEVNPTKRRRPAAPRGWRSRVDPFEHSRPVIEGRLIETLLRQLGHSWIDWRGRCPRRTRTRSSCARGNAAARLGVLSSSRSCSSEDSRRKPSPKPRRLDRRSVRPAGGTGCFAPALALDIRTMRHTAHRARPWTTHYAALPTAATVAHMPTASTIKAIHPLQTTTTSHVTLLREATRPLTVMVVAQPRPQTCGPAAQADDDGEQYRANGSNTVQRPAESVTCSP